MALELILDTSALVCLLDRSQAEHATCVDFFREWTGNVASTEAVLTEATHLLARVHGGRSACLEFFLAGGATLVPSDTAALRRCSRLIERYGDLPMDRSMDFGDATLVVLADELRTDAIFTLDADFDVYRRRDGTPFRRVPA